MGKTGQSCSSSMTKARCPEICPQHIYCGKWRNRGRQIPGYWTTNIQESRHKSRHRSASNLDKGHKSAPSWPSVEGEGGLSGNGAEPNCNSGYHGSSRQRGGADGSLGRFTTTEFYPKFRKILENSFTDVEVTIFSHSTISSFNKESSA